MRITESSEKIERYQGVLWEPIYQIDTETKEKRSHDMRGPLCLDCKVYLKFEPDPTIGVCPNCSREHKLLKTPQDLRQLARLAYEGKIRDSYPVGSLDLPPGVVKSSDEDEHYWVEARIGQKNGKKMAVIYFGEKKRGTQDKKDYTQTFIDFDEEQIRFDKGNKNPLEIISKLTAEFLGSLTEASKK